MFNLIDVKTGSVLTTMTFVEMAVLIGTDATPDINAAINRFNRTSKTTRIELV